MSLTIREMQIKITVRYHFIHTRMLIIKKKTVTSTVNMWRNWNPYTLLVEMKN